MKPFFVFLYAIFSRTIIPKSKDVPVGLIFAFSSILTTNMEQIMLKSQIESKVSLETLEMSILSN